MSDLKMTSLDEFLQDTFSEEFLQEAAVEYKLAQIAGRAHKEKEQSTKDKPWKKYQKLGMRAHRATSRLKTRP